MKVGQTFDERYELVDILGAGGTGSVWRATDSVLNREVALKILRVGGPDDETMRARLRTEARVAGSLDHPGIGAVYDYGETSDGPYIVMAVVPGEPLSQVLRRERLLGAQRVMSIVAQVAAALEVAHHAGIVHRDLKPGNVMVSEDDRAVLVDFGIARSHDYEPLTMTGTLVGTVDYVSPEQIAGRSATSRSDLYSLGMLAYEALTGLKPFRRESQVATALAHLQEEVPPLPPEVPEGVRVLVERMVAKDPDLRPQTAAQVAALARAALQAPDEVTQALPALPPASPPQPAARERRGTDRRAVLLVGVSTVMAMLAFFGFQGAGETADEVETQRLVDVVGLRAAQAVDRLEADGLVVQRERTRDTKAPRGEVVEQVPAAGAQVEPGSIVTLVVAAARPQPEQKPTTVPSSPVTTATPLPSPTARPDGGGGGRTGAKTGEKAPAPGGGRPPGSGQEKQEAPGNSAGRGKGRGN